MHFGIDLGTTNSTITYWIQTGEKTFDIRTIRNNKGNTLTPSVVLFEKETGKVIVGNRAFDDYDYESGRSIRWVKRFMGKEHKFMIDGKDYSPQVISAYILKSLKMFAEKDLQKAESNGIKNIVITVPADFDSNAKQATIDAAKIAGFANVELIAEPNAAVLNYVFRSQEVGRFGETLSEKEKYYIVFDLGGGTFDVSLSGISLNSNGKPNTSVISSSGDKYLGGANFDNDLMLLVLKKAKKLYSEDIEKLDLLIEAAKTFINNEFISNEDIRSTVARLSKECEIGKIELTDEHKKTFSFISHYGKTYRVEILRSEFEQVVLTPYIARMKTHINNVLKEAIGKSKINSWIDLEGVILVGGSANIPKVISFCEEVFGRKPIDGVDTFESVAKGAAIYSAMKSGYSDIVGSYSTIVPHNIGLLEDGRFEAVLHKGDQNLEAIYNYEIPFSLDTKTPIQIAQQYHDEMGEPIILPIEQLSYSHPFIYTGDKIDIILKLDDSMILTVKIKEKCVYDSVELRVDNPIKLNNDEIEVLRDAVASSL